MFNRALRLGDWEIEVQLPCGAVRRSYGLKAEPAIFNTGQVIFGWVELFRITDNKNYLNAAIRAGDWLLENQDLDGKWSRFTYMGIPHSYNTRVAWALLELYSATGDTRYHSSAIRNIQWVLRNSDPDGWVRHMGFVSGVSPYTHTIAYTLRGLVESARYVTKPLEEKILNCVYRASEKLLMIFELNKSCPYSNPEYLPGEFDEGWTSHANYSCLTGNAQIAIVWMKIYQLFNDARFLNGAMKIVDQLKKRQNLKTRNIGLNGGISGSYPIWGTYLPYAFPNWASKFFCDAIMMQESMLEKLKVDASK